MAYHPDSESRSKCNRACAETQRGCKQQPAGSGWSHSLANEQQQQAASEVSMRAFCCLASADFVMTPIASSSHPVDRIEVGSERERERETERARERARERERESTGILQQHPLLISQACREGQQS